MKKYILSLAVVILSLSQSTLACCYVQDLYQVTNISENDYLNVRQEPHPLSSIVDMLSHNQRYFQLQRLSVPKREMQTHALCVSVDYQPFGRKKTTSQWCKLRKPNGWVNMHYLSSCEVETGDLGNIIRTECSDVAIGKTVPDYLFSDKKP